MSALGLIGSVLAGAASGAGQGVADSAMEQMKEEAKLKEIQASAEAQGRIAQQTHAINATFDKKIADEYRQARLLEIKAYSAPTKGFTTGGGIVAENAGLSSADTVGADEGVGTDVQNRTRPATMRDAEQRALEAGDLDSMSKIGTTVDRNQRADTDAAHRKSQDEQWKTQFAELTRHHKAIENKAASEMGLKETDRRELSAAMAGYSKAVKFRTMMSPDSTPQDIAMIEGDIAAGAAQLAQFGVKVPSPGMDSKGALKVVAGEPGARADLVHEDNKGRITRVDPSTLPSYGTGNKTTKGQYQPGQILEKKDGSRWQVDASGTPQLMK